MEKFTSMLAGGHPNSLGRTIEVVELVCGDQTRMRELLDCYKCDDEVVRLRVSSSLKRVEAEHHDWLVPYIDELIDDVGQPDQASARWTLAQLFDRLSVDLSADQRKRAVALLKRNLQKETDWIVVNTTLDTLSRWAGDDLALRTWMKPHVERLAKDERKSVAGRAAKVAKKLFRE